MNQIIHCPFCQDMLKVHSVIWAESEEYIIATWFCDVCHAEIERCGFTGAEIDEILTLIKVVDKTIEFAIDGECDE